MLECATIIPNKGTLMYLIVVLHCAQEYFPYTVPRQPVLRWEKGERRTGETHNYPLAAGRPSQRLRNLGMSRT